MDPTSLPLSSVLLLDLLVQEAAPWWAGLCSGNVDLFWWLRR